MNNIDKFISTCESMIIENESVNEGAIGKVIIGAHAATAGLVGMAFLFNSITEKRDNKKLIERDLFAINKYLKNAKEIEVTKNLITALLKYNSIIPIFEKELKKLLHENVGIIKKYGGNTPSDIKKEIDIKLSNFDKKYQLFIKDIKKLITNDTSEKLHDMKYKNIVDKSINLFFDMENYGDGNDWEIVADILGLGSSVDDDEKFINKVYYEINTLFKVSDDIFSLSRKLIGKVKIRVK